VEDCATVSISPTGKETRLTCAVVCPQMPAQGSDNIIPSRTIMLRAEHKKEVCRVLYSAPSQHGLRNGQGDAATCQYPAAGHVPALEWSGLLVGEPDGGANGFQTARAIVRRIQDSGVRIAAAQDLCSDCHIYAICTSIRKPASSQPSPVAPPVPACYAPSGP